MTDKPPYQPIDCSVHDRLEAFATLRTMCCIAFRTADGRLGEEVDRIVDVFTRGREEFLRTSSGREIRLDRLESVEAASQESFRRESGQAGSC
jgi:transcriptional antiterminator Rof (Rho-off)